MCRCEGKERNNDITGSLFPEDTRLIHRWNITFVLDLLDVHKISFQENGQKRKVGLKSYSVRAFSKTIP